jgi:hypothetical protein
MHNTCSPNSAAFCCSMTLLVKQYTLRRGQSCCVMQSHKESVGCTVALVLLLLDCGCRTCWCRWRQWQLCLLQFHHAII